MKTKVSDLINEYNDTTKFFDKLKLDELLKISNEVFSDQIAVIDKQREITYKDLYFQVL